MMWATFIAANWSKLLIIALIAALTATWNRYANEHNARIAEAAIWQERAAQAEAKAQEIEARSHKTVEVINANHKKRLADAVSNARSNWAFVGRLPSQSAMPDGDHPADRAENPDDPAADRVVGGTLTLAIDQCAATTVQVIEWQEWARMNHLPVESE
jgi:predicted S18 family serine protease